MDMSESKSTSQPNSRLYSRKTKLSEIDEKNELLKAKLNKVECSHVESKSFSTAMKNPLSQEDSIWIQKTLNRVVDLSKRRATIKTDIKPIPHVKRKIELL